MVRNISQYHQEMVRLDLMTGLLLATIFLFSPGTALAQQHDLTAAAPDEVRASYHLRAGDKLSIRFLYQPELNEPSVVISPDGTITLQLIDEIKAAGLTTRELKKNIEVAYSEILLNPVITVNLLEFVAPRVFVNGQVVKPGSYELRAGQTVWQAIALAGGFTNAAHRKMVLHGRATGNQTLKVTVVDITQLMTPGTREREIMLADGDYIFIPDSRLSKLTRVMEAFRFLVPGFTIN